MMIMMNHRGWLHMVMQWKRLDSVETREGGGAEHRCRGKGK